MSLFNSRAADSPLEGHQIIKDYWQFKRNGSEQESNEILYYPQKRP